MPRSCVIPLQLLILPHHKLCLVQFLHLMVNILPRCPIRPSQILAKNLLRFLRIPFRIPSLPYFTHQLLQPRKTIQRPPLRRRRKQGLMIMRPMQIHQPIPQLLQHRQSHGRTIQKLPPRPRTSHLPLNNQRSIPIRLDSLLLQPTSKSFRSTQLPLHHTSLRPRPHQTPIRPFPQQK